MLGTHFGVSGQSMAEFVAVARRKSLLEDSSLDGWLVFLSGLPRIDVDDAYVRAGLDVSRRHRIEYYDAALLAAAEACPAVAISVVDDATGEQVFP